MMLHPRGGRGPSGKIELAFEHSESGSGHHDCYETTTLSAENDQIVLTLETRDTDAINGTSDTRAERYAISPDELSELIKKHGSRL